MLKNLLKSLLKYNLTISSVESFTGGMFAKCFTDNSGSSGAFVGSLVTYQTRVKEEILKISGEILANFGVVSKDVAYEMALKGKQYFNSDICVSFTGNAGPTVCEDNKPVGLCFIGINFLDEIKVFELHFDLKRNEIRKESVKRCEEELLKMIKNKKKLILLEKNGDKSAS